jgi:hypothetical protein
MPSSSRFLLGSAALLTLLATTACRNNCQQLCQDMADFAAEDCGEEFSKDDVKSCMDAYHNREIDDEADEVCEDISSSLREEWTCDDIKEYFTEDSPSGGGGSDDTGS